MKEKTFIFNPARLFIFPHLFFVLTVVVYSGFVGCAISPEESSSSSSLTSSSSLSSFSYPLPKLRKVTYYDAGGNMTHYVYMGTNFILNGKEYTGDLNYRPSGELYGYYIDGFPQPGYGQWREYPGDDGILLTDDDFWSFVYVYDRGNYIIKIANFEKQASYDDPFGLYISIEQHIEINTNYNITNITITNMIKGYHRDYHDRLTNVTRRVKYTAGLDGELFTLDDEVYAGMWDGLWNATPQPKSASYYDMTYSNKTMSIWWCWDTIKMYDDPGPDWLWFTEDDRIFEFAKHEFNDPVNPNYWTKEWVYTNAGPDGKWGTSDDILYRYAIATNYY